MLFMPRYLSLPGFIDNAISLLMLRHYFLPIPDAFPLVELFRFSPAILGLSIHLTSPNLRLLLLIFLDSPRPDKVRRRNPLGQSGNCRHFPKPRVNSHLTRLPRLCFLSPCLTDSKPAETYCFLPRRRFLPITF